MERITIHIAPDATMTVQAVGFKGKTCAQATADLLRDLAGKQDTTRTSDYYTPEGDVHVRRNA